MQDFQEKRDNQHNKEETLIRQESRLIYPKEMPAYIVAFAVSENDNEINVEETPNIENPRNSTTPTNASNTHLIQQNSSLSLDFVANVTDRLNEIKNKVEDSREDRDFASVENVSSVIISQPLVIFNANRRKTKCEAVINKKTKKYKRGVKVKNTHSKYKHSSNYMKRTLQRWYRGTEKNILMQKYLYSVSVSLKISRSHVLKKEVAKENLLDEVEKYSLTYENSNKNIDNAILNDSGSFISPPTDGNLSFLSDSSQNTLTREDSLSSRNDDATTKNSVIHLKRDNSPYKNDIINVAVAQINNTPTLSRNSYSIIVPQIDKNDFKNNLTETEAILSRTIMLTSTSSGLISNKTYLNSDETSSDISKETLIPPNQISATSSNTYEIAKTSSYFRSSNLDSNFNLTYNSDNTQDIDINFNLDSRGQNNHTQSLYDEVMNVNIYPNMSLRSSSTTNLPNNFNNTIIAEDVHKTTHQICKFSNRGDEEMRGFERDFGSNVFQKPLTVRKDVEYQANIKLPNAADLKATIVESTRIHGKCSEEARTCYPSSFPELCDKLTIVLEIAVKQLEHTLSNKIVNELKKSLHEFEKHANPIPKFNADPVETELKKEKLIELEKLNHVKAKKVTSQIDVYLQCDIVQNDAIDKIMANYNPEVEKYGIQSSSSTLAQKLKKPKRLKEYLEVLKVPIPPRGKEIGKGDESVQISVEDTVYEDVSKLDYVTSFICTPIGFIKENIAVIATVPVFFFVVFIIYIYIVLLLKMW